VRVQLDLVKLAAGGWAFVIRGASYANAEIFREKNCVKRMLPVRRMRELAKRPFVFPQIFLVNNFAISVLRRLKEFLRKRRSLLSDQCLTRRRARRRFIRFPRRARRLRRKESLDRRRNLRLR